MTVTAEDRARALRHLHRAQEIAGQVELPDVQPYVEQGELERAVDLLAVWGAQRADQPRPFWEALQYAYDELRLTTKAKLCRFRSYESEHGFVEAQLILMATADGGRSGPIFTDYRADWDIGNRTDAGDLEINGAPVTLEDMSSLEPGMSGRVRLHPIWREGWMNVAPGQTIAMHEGARVVGRAVVLRVTLR